MVTFIIRLAAMELLLARDSAGRLAFQVPSQSTRISRGVPRRSSVSCGCGGELPAARELTISPSTSAGTRACSSRGTRTVDSRLFCTSAGCSGVGVAAPPTNCPDGQATAGSSSGELADGGVRQEEKQRDEVAVGPLTEQSQLARIQPVLRKFLDFTSDGRVKKVALKARQHVNPLSASFQMPVEMPEGWFHHSFQNPSAPLHVDIGCAKAAFVGSMAQAFPEQNFLGLEIRRPVAAYGLRRSMVLGLKNCHVVCCNANIDLDPLLNEATSQGAAIDTISIQFPDPCFKAKKQKRRVLQPELVSVIEKHLRPGGMFFMQSDYFPIVEEMRLLTREVAEVLVDSHEDLQDWMEGPENNPFGVPTERETATYAKEDPAENRVYRAIFRKGNAHDSA